MAEGYAEQYEQTISSRHVRVVSDRQRRPGRRHVPGDRGAARPHRRGRAVPAASPRLDRHARGARRGRRDAGRVRPGRPGLPAGRTRRRGEGRARGRGARRRCATCSGCSWGNSTSAGARPTGSNTRRRTRCTSPGARVGHVCTEDCPLDKSENLCTQTESGVSPRAAQALLHFAQALAYFRGRDRSRGRRRSRRCCRGCCTTSCRRTRSRRSSRSRRTASTSPTACRGCGNCSTARWRSRRLTHRRRKRTLELARACGSGRRGRRPRRNSAAGSSSIRDRIEEVLRETELNAVTHADLVLLKDLYVQCRNELDRRESGK